MSTFLKTLVLALAPMFDILKLPHEVADARGAKPLEVTEGAIEFKDVSFEFNSSRKVLDTIITLSPLLGLLGTVTGMIAAFGILSTTGMNQPTAITGGVAEALIATAVGLAIAIGTLVPYNYFTARAERAMDAMERAASRLDLALREQRIP